MNPILSLLVDNVQTSLTSFVVPDMNLSSARAEMKRHTFVFAIDTNRMVEFLEPAYSAWVDESRRDDEVCGGPQDDLALAGYPPLNRLIETPALIQLVLGYLREDFLGKLTWDGKSPIQYWFDCVTACDADDREVRLSGVCYGKK